MNLLRRSLHALAALLSVHVASSQSLLVDSQPALIAGFRSVVPRIQIDTSGASVDDKSTWVRGTVTIDGQGAFGDYVGSMDIRGRGNTSWRLGLQYGKKPFRLRLEQAAPLLGLAPERNWILLANYIDGTLMANAIAFAAGQLLEIPFTHHMIPVDVYFNGEYLGNYMFTEHKEVAPNRIDIGDTGVLLELDTNFDEDFKFTSGNFELPVMIQHPDLGDLLEVDATAKLDSIRYSFEELELLISAPEFFEKRLEEILDPHSFAKFMIVVLLSTNRELNHPKSLYMHTIGDGPFQMGPIWDFDWAYGFNTTNKVHFVRSAARRPTPLATSTIDGSPNKGGLFLLSVLEHEVFRRALLEEWEHFEVDLLPTLLEYVRLYAYTISDSYSRDFERWHETEWQIARSPDFDGEVVRIEEWLGLRSAYLSTCLRDMTRFTC